MSVIVSREAAIEVLIRAIRDKFPIADWYERLLEKGFEIEDLFQELPPVTPTEKDKRIKELEDLFADMLESAQSAPMSTPTAEDMGEVSDGYHTFNQLYHQRAVLFATIVNQNKNKAWKSWKHEDGKFCFDKGGEWFIVGVDTPEGSYTYHYEKKYWDLFDCEELDRGKHWDGHTEEDVTRLLSLPTVTHDKRTETHGVCSDCIWNTCNYNKIDWEASEDCISRKQAVEAVTNALWHYPNQLYKNLNMYEVAWGVVSDALRDLPPVTPTERTGEWIKKSDGIIFKREWGICSECGNTLDFAGLNAGRGDANFCPNCGAKMKGGDRNDMEEVIEELNYMRQRNAQLETMLHAQMTFNEQDAIKGGAVMRDATAEERASVQRYIDSISTDSVQGWIPCSERLPDAEYGEGESVLCCTESGLMYILYWNGGNWCVPTGEPHHWVNHKTGWHDKVIAWMPLPEPYTGEMVDQNRMSELYIKVRVKDDPGTKAEKLYQICEPEELEEVAKYLDEYIS